MRFNGALGFGGGYWVRACRHDLSGLIWGRCVRARTLRLLRPRYRGGTGAGDGRGGDGVLSGSGGVAGGYGGWADVVVAGGRRLLAHQPELQHCAVFGLGYGWTGKGNIWIARSGQWSFPRISAAAASVRSPGFWAARRARFAGNWRGVARRAGRSLTVARSGVSRFMTGAGWPAGRSAGFFGAGRAVCSCAAICLISAGLPGRSRRHCGACIPMIFRPA